MDYKKTAAEILKLVGGEKNVASVTNYMTRLRFNLNDAKKADVEAIKKIKGVQGVVTKNGQFQVSLYSQSYAGLFHPPSFRMPPYRYSRLCICHKFPQLFVLLSSLV